MAADGTIVLTQDRSSGMVHKRVRVGKSLASLEADNLDAAGKYDVIAGLNDAVYPFRLCARCFPPDEAAPDDEPVAPV